MPGYDGVLFVLTFDHRASFTRDPFGFSVTPTLGKRRGSPRRRRSS